MTDHTDNPLNPHSPLRGLPAFGQSLWYDNISRTLLGADGGLATMIREDGVCGVTSNPTIFEKAITEGDAYDDQIRALVRDGKDGKEVLRALTTDDVRDACDLLADAHRASGGQDGYVSIEVSPYLAHDTAATVEEAADLWQTVGRPNLMLKIPGTAEGMDAITETLAAGINVNVTLIFGLTRYDQVMEAYLAGLSRLDDPSSVRSVASFFVSRIDSEADKRLEAAGHPELGGQLAIANAKLAYQHFTAMHSGPRWAALADRGAHPQRPLWASTSTKNPEYSDLMYINPLVGADTVGLMPPVTLDAYRDHGELPPAGSQPITEGTDDARALLGAIEDAGVRYDDVIDTLEREGVEKFEASWGSLEHFVAEKVEAFRAAEVGSRG